MQIRGAAIGVSCCMWQLNKDLMKLCSFSDTQAIVNARRYGENNKDRSKNILPQRHYCEKTSRLQSYSGSVS